eukprot:scaffold6754_cov148-Amphora_coffeaeformis.AAC.6
MVAGSTPRCRSCLAKLCANWTFSGYGMPWERMVDSRATTGRFSAKASWTGAYIWRGIPPPPPPWEVDNDACRCRTTRALWGRGLTPRGGGGRHHEPQDRLMMRRNNMVNHLVYVLDIVMDYLYLSC